MDDRSVIVHNPNFTNFEKLIHMILKNTNNLLSQNFGKTHFMKFITKHSTHKVININYNNKIILNTSTLNFLRIINENTLSWKSHFDMIPSKLSQACCMVRMVKPFPSQGDS